MSIRAWRGPAWRVFGAHYGQVRVVRSWIGSAVASYGVADADDVALAADELFANAVQHGPRHGRILVGYCLWPEGIRIVVADGGGSTRPCLRAGTELAAGGRGLQLVDSVSVLWGILRLPGTQVVWCDFGQPLQAHGADSWAWLRLVLADCDLSPHDPASAEARPRVLTGIGAP